MIDNVIFLIVMVAVPVLCFLGSRADAAEQKEKTSKASLKMRRKPHLQTRNNR